MEGLAASVLLIAILLGVLLIIGGLVYLLAQRLPERSSQPRKPVNRWIGIGGIVLVVLIIGLWAGIKSASNPQPQPPGPPPNCPTGGIWTPLQELCIGQL
jgi:uncharacterized membrane protein